MRGRFKVDKKERIKELVDILNKASKAYYQDAKEIMSNFEYDALYDELVQLEKDTGIVLANSPTVNVGYEVVSELPKEQHESPMLSLDKTKEVSVLADFAGDKKSLLSWKLDGLTVVLTYQQGKLFKAVTRGNGEIGEVITSKDFIQCNKNTVVNRQYIHNIDGTNRYITLVENRGKLEIGPRLKKEFLRRLEND